MQKFILILSLLFLLQGIHAQDEQCNLSYQSVPPVIECEYVENDQGEEIEECLIGDPIVETAVLNPETNIIINEDFQLDFMDFIGHCHCSLTLYSAENLGGCYARASVAGEEFETLRVRDFWPRENNPESFSVTCQF